jgi:hypothetical protein
MARSVRVEFPGAFYHVMARGNRREPIFLDKEDGKQFVKALGEVCAMTAKRRNRQVPSRLTHFINRAIQAAE